MNLFMNRKLRLALLASFSMCVLFGSLVICIIGVAQRPRSQEYAIAQIHHAGGRVSGTYIDLPRSKRGFGNLLISLRQFQSISGVSLRFSDISVEDAKKIATIKGMSTIDLRGTRISVEALTEPSAATEVACLDVSENATLEQCAAVLPKFTSLNRLILRGVNIDKALASQLDQCHSLRALHLNNASMSKDTLIKLMHKPGLNELTVVNSEICCDNIKSTIMENSSLMFLTLSCHEDDFKLFGDIVSSQVHFQELQSLKLGCDSTEIGSCVRAFENHKELLSLDIIAFGYSDKESHGFRSATGQRLSVTVSHLQPRE